MAWPQAIHVPCYLLWTASIHYAVAEQEHSVYAVGGTVGPRILRSTVKHMQALFLQAVMPHRQHHGSFAALLACSAKSNRDTPSSTYLVHTATTKRITNDCQFHLGICAPWKEGWTHMSSWQQSWHTMVTTVCGPSFEAYMRRTETPNC